MRNKIKQGIRMLFVLAGITYMASGCGFAEQAELLKNELSKAGIESGKPKEPQKKKKKQKKSEKKTPAKETETKAPSEAGTEEDTESAGQFPKREEDLAYADNYAYQTLTDTEKEVYHEMLTAILEHEEEIDVSTLEVDLLETVYKALCSDYGGLYWVSGYAYTQYTRGGEAVGLKFAPKYTMDAQERETLQQQIDASVEELLAGISITDSDYAKAKYVFEILVQNVDYDASVLSAHF